MKKSNRRSKGISVYANLTARHRSKLDARARRKAEYLASLPKHPVKRLLYRMHPKRVVKFWFSREGAITLLKLAGVGIVIVAILIAALFAFYRRELDAIKPSELAKRVQTTVSKYEDRNGVLLWEDKGEGDYKMVIESQDIAKVMKEATIAIEDKDFYSHGGISISGIVRAGLSNATGSGNVQGASTLTQQLIKQVFFEKDAEQNRLSVSRKIKEIILAIEVERMYNKDQILTLYLNEVPYGGRRNGVQSASLTYFGKPAKDLTLPEAAMLAAIPQNPSYFNPYNEDPDAHKALIARQHKVLDDMVGQNNITKEQAEEAKAYPILDNIKDEFADAQDMKAPHFVQAVRDQLEAEFGTKVIREGGLTIKTTLDYRLQETAQQSITNNFKHATAVGADNMAFTAVDVPTGQVLAQVGSHNFYDKANGAVNAATRNLEPGSSIKPFVYGNLFKPQQGQNYGAGSILSDESVKSIYDGKELHNFDNRFYGTMSIREALALSRNPPAVKAAYIGGIDKAVQTARDVGDLDYCKNIQYGLSAAIGTCPVHLDQHTNAYATIARQGIYKPIAYTLEVKNAQGQVLKQWKDESKRVLDAQITYILSDILSDPNARSRVFGRAPVGMVIPNVKTATKTGTTDRDEKPQYGWMMAFSPRLATGVWMGRSDAKPIRTLSSVANGNVTKDVMTKAHMDIFAKDGSWKQGDWFTKPEGIKNVTINGRNDIFPSWYNKPQNADGEKVAFDQVSKKKATDCTPARAKVELTVQTFEDPITKRKTSTAPDGYDASATDDIHKCDDVKPFVSIDTTKTGAKKYKITASVNKGTHALTTVDIAVNGQVVSSQAVSGAGDYSIEHTFPDTGTATVSATVVDSALYDNAATKTINVVAGGSGDDPVPLRRNRWF